MDDVFEFVSGGGGKAWVGRLPRRRRWWWSSAIVASSSASTVEVSPLGLSWMWLAVRRS
jgi:hypothetical protein